MNTPRKSSDILLNRYPDAHHITHMVSGPETVKENSKRQDVSLADSFFSELLTSLPQYAANKNLFVLLRSAAERVFSNSIIMLLADYEHLVFQKDMLAKSLRQQCLHSLPDEIRQLCFLASKLNQSTAHRFVNWQEIFARFPLIEQKLTLHAHHMLTVLRDLLSKLDKDKELLTSTFNIRTFAIRNIQISLGDFHQLGKSVVRIDFGANAIIYKPRSADNEAFTLALLDFINAEIMHLRIGIPAFINRNEYSWHEFVTFQNPDNAQDVLDYYRNIGAAVLFFHLINGSDFHHENIICVNNTPYFVDLEMILSRPQPRGFFTDSILNTIIIPTLAGSPIDKYVCGIGIPDIEGGFIHTNRVSIDEKMNIQSEIVPTRIKSYSNIPVISDPAVTHKALVDAIKDGFDCMCQLIKQNQQLVPFIKTFTSLKGRVIFRSSRSYYEMMQLAKQPAYAAELEARNIFLSCILYEETKALDVIQYEHKAVSEGRIPVFYMNMLSGKYYTADGTELNINDSHSFKNYMTKVYRMINSDEENVLQKSLLNISLDSLYPERSVIHKKQEFIEKTVDFMAGKEVTYKKKDLILNVKKDVNGANIITTMESDIYNGLSGAAFMQLCNIILNRSAQKEKKLEALYLRANKYNTNETFGGFEMNGGLLYLEYLFHKNLISWFDVTNFNQRLLNIIKIIRTQDPHVDIISGMAGILIICSRMYLLCPKQIYKSAIKFLATSIMQKAIYVEHDIVAWHKKWTGFAHGNSGIVYALLLANNILKNKEINQLAIRALKYEQTFKIPDGWKGVDVHDREEDFNAWCHGATGIYLSRVAMLDENYIEDNELIDILYSDIEHYMETKAERGINLHPSLCHGAYGNAMIDPLSYGEYLHVDYSAYTPSEDKSLMHGRPGALYADLFINNSNKGIPNLLLLK